MDGAPLVLGAAAALLLCLQLTCTGAADSSCPGASTSTSVTLKKKLFCSYDSSVRPVKLHTNTTDVSMHMWLKFLEFNEHFDTLEIHSWVVWKWQDEHLTWDKQQYGGVSSLYVLSSQLWVPDVTIYNAGSLDSTGTGMPTTRCTVASSGNVSCVAPTRYVAECRPDIRMWPFDSHNCSVRIGSWTQSGENLNLTLDKKGITMLDYEDSRDWELVAWNATRHSYRYKNNTYPVVLFRFELRRHPGSQAASVITPAVALAVLTLVSFWLGAESPHRLALLCVDVICHSLFMMYLGVMLPANGVDTPVIVTFFRDSFILVVVALMATLSAAHMNAAAQAPPAWVTTVTQFILSLPPGQILLLGKLDPKGAAGAAGAEDGAGLVAAPAEGGWRLFAVLLDRTLFIIFTCTLFILLCAYIP